MPKPNQGEEHDAYIERCVSMVLDDGAAEGQDQAVAMCQAMWEDAADGGEDDGDEASKGISEPEMTGTVHERFISAFKNRGRYGLK